MTGLLKAIGRLFSGVLYLLTFGFVNLSKQIESKPGVIKAQFDDVIREKRARIQQYMDAVAEIVTIREQKKALLSKLSAEVEKLQVLKRGAAAKAQKAVAALKAAGRSVEEISADDTVKTCQSAYKDFSSTLNEKEARCGDLEKEIVEYERKIEDHKRQLKSLQRDLDKIKAESAETVADVITAQEEEKVANLLNGLSDDKSGETLERLREMRQKAKAKAEVAEQLAGTDTRREEAEFIEFAQANETDAEFSELIGLGEQKALPPSAPKLLTEGSPTTTSDETAVEEPAVVKTMGPR